MKLRLLVLAVAAPFISVLHAQPQPVPDSGSSIGSIVIGVAVLFALRRKLVK